MLGEELKDPQTGRSLGRNETPCCTIRVDRVAAQTSYGTIEGGADLGGANFKPGAIELRQLAGAVKPAAASAANGGSAKPKPARAAAPKAAAPAEDPNW
jgi:hypothetical protein